MEEVGGDLDHPGLEPMGPPGLAQAANAGGDPEAAGQAAVLVAAQAEIRSEAVVAAACRGLGDPEVAAGIHAAAGEFEQIEQVHVAQQGRRLIRGGGFLLLVPFRGDQGWGAETRHGLSPRDRGSGE
jgi:hypothetical protein